MVWDEETIRQLQELWSQGHSTAEIGRRLGVSKNAIVGKAHRLDLDARPSPIRRDAAKLVTERPAPFARMAGPTLPPLASAGAQSFTTAAFTPPAFTPPAFTPQAFTPQAIITPAIATLSNVQPLRAEPVLAVRPVALTPTRPPGVVPPPRPVMQSAPMQARRSAPSCCWPIGEPGTKAFRFCDDTSVPGKPYCDEHARLAYVRIRDR